VAKLNDHVRSHGRRETRVRLRGKTLLLHGRCPQKLDRVGGLSPPANLEVEMRSARLAALAAQAHYVAPSHPLAGSHADLGEVRVDAEHGSTVVQPDDVAEPRHDAREAGAMTPQQIFGNWLATRLISLFYGVHYTDLGPFRAISYASLLAINMQDKTFGWTVEMQVKAARKQIPALEIPVRYRKRHAGKSKVSGTLYGTVMAGYKIITTIIRYALKR